MSQCDPALWLKSMLTHPPSLPSRFSRGDSSFSSPSPTFLLWSLFSLYFSRLFVTFSHHRTLFSPPISDHNHFPALHSLLDWCTLSSWLRHREVVNRRGLGLSSHSELVWSMCHQCSLLHFMFKKVIIIIMIIISTLTNHKPTQT